MSFPRSVKSHDKLKYLVECIERIERGDSSLPKSLRVLFYTPWNKAAKKIKGYDCRVNLFDVPEAFHEIVDWVGKENFKQSNINYVPTLVTFKYGGEDNAPLQIEVNDNPTAIQYELGSRG